MEISGRKAVLALKVLPDIRLVDQTRLMGNSSLLVLLPCLALMVGQAVLDRNPPMATEQLETSLVELERRGRCLARAFSQNLPRNSEFQLLTC